MVRPSVVGKSQTVQTGELERKPVRDVVEDRRRCRTSDLGQDAKDDQPDATADARPAGCAPRERDDTIVLHTQQVATSIPAPVQQAFCWDESSCKCRACPICVPTWAKVVEGKVWAMAPQKEFMPAAAPNSDSQQKRRQRHSECMCSLARHRSHRSLKGGQGVRECWGATPCWARKHVPGPHHRQGCRPGCAGRGECR